MQDVGMSSARACASRTALEHEDLRAENERLHRKIIQIHKFYLDKIKKKDGHQSSEESAETHC